MALLLQGYAKVSDAEAVDLTVVDARWRMVLDHFEDEPAFSQGALHDFRHRMIKYDLDRRLLERTVEIARTTKGFDPRKLPTSLRVAMDSSPLEGAGRVEDTINLLGHTARQGAQQRDQSERDRKHIAARRETLLRELEEEPRAIVASYETVRRRVEPVGLVYLWPTTR